MNSAQSPILTPLDERSRALRRLIVRALAGGGRGHVGAAFSLVEILRVLYDHILRFDPRNANDASRDRLILSKGHGCLALYALLADKGFFPVSALDQFCHFDGMLGGHPDARKVPGVEASTGSLGHGPSIGVGMALAAKRDKASWRTFVIIGDGESNEGSVWEAALCAAKHALDNLTLIIDYNKMQANGLVAEVLPLEPLAGKLTAFGFLVREVDGHDIGQLRRAFSGVPFAAGKPSAVICHTVKGRGFSKSEHNAQWHHRNRISAEEIDEMLRELGK